MEQTIIIKPTKNVGLAIMLSIILGPIGTFYATILGGIGMLGTAVFVFVTGMIITSPPYTEYHDIVSVVFFLFAMMMGIINVFVAGNSAHNYNKKLLNEQKEILKSKMKPKTTNIITPENKAKLIASLDDDDMVTFRNKRMGYDETAKASFYQKMVKEYGEEKFVLLKVN